MYQDTVTLFNRLEGRAGDTWYATVLRGVHLNTDRAAIMAKYGAETQDAAILNVRYTADKRHKNVCGKRWLPPKKWEELEDHSAALTFTAGTRFDFFMVGEWDGASIITPEDVPVTYTGLYDYLNATRDFVFSISSVGGPYSVIQHFEITGK
jgi:hypothetical protein